jgi:hypothetical protein
VAILRNEHGLHWGDPIAHWHGPEDGWRGYCSPNIIKNDDAWFIVFNSWGDTSTDQYNRLFYVRTTDWSTFTDPLPLAHELLADTPVIDGALAYSNGRWFLGCNKTNVHPRSMHFASSANLAGPWEWVIDGRPELFAHGMNIESGFLHENGQLICADETWYLVSTDYRPHQPWLYRLTGDPAEPRNWSRWHDGRPLRIRGESWNDVDTINAVSLWDHRAVDGYWYAVYGGKSTERCNEFHGTTGRKPWPRGWNRLGFARSRDLWRWYLPGEAE